MEPKDRVELVIKTKMDAREEKASSGNRPAEGASFVVEPGVARSIIEGWPPAAQKSAEELLKTYGAPNEATPTLLIWHDSGPWKRTVVTSDETAHDFPSPHTDHVSQTINYHVPASRMRELAEFDGSLIVHRTAGQVTSSCDAEAANFVAVNLMNDIVTGKLTVEEARKELAEQKAAWLMNRPAPYTEGIAFSRASEDETGDLDEAIMKGPVVHQTVEKVKDVLGINEQR